MMHIAHSTFLQALGCAIINSLWQFAFLWLVYFLVNTFFKVSSRHRYSLGLLLQFTGFIWFAGTFIFYYQHWNSISNASGYITDFSFITLNSTAGSLKDVWLSWLANAEYFLPYLSIAYLLLLLFLSIKWLRSYSYTQQIKQSGLSKMHVDWRLFVQRISEQLGIQKKVSIYLSDMVKTPLTIGFLKPVILIPLASINHLSTEQMEAVILHELAHIKRFDYLINLLLTLVEVVMFFNPFMQLLSKHIKRERENSCDDWVLQYEYSAATYARALLKIALLQSPSPSSFAMNAAMDNRDVLLTRVKRMIEKSEKSFHYKHQLFAFVITTIVLSFIAWLSPINNDYSVATATNLSEVRTLPIAAKIDNPLFNPVFFLADVQKEAVVVKRTMNLTNERKLYKHIPAVAVREKNYPIDIHEIVFPVIINSSAINNKLEISAKMKIAIDTILNNVRMTKLYATAIFAKIDKTEKDIRRTLSEMQKHLIVKQPYTKEAVTRTMTMAIEHLRAAKLNLAKNKYATAKNLMLFMDEAKSQEETIDDDGIPADEEELQKLTEEINKQLEEVRQQYLAKTDEYRWDNYNIPAVVHAPSSAHSYSFEYPDKLGERVASTPSSSAQVFTQSRTADKTAISTENTNANKGEEEIIITISPAKQPVKKIAIKKIQTIRI